MRKQIFFVLLFTCSLSCPAQWFVGVKLMGISIHTDKHINGHLYENTIGKKKRVAFHLGVALACEYKVNNWFSLKADQVLFRDCAGKLAGISMFNFRYTQDLGGAGDGSVGLGPFFYYRKSWLPIEEYTDDGYFKESANKKWQTKFVWYGTELEHNYRLNDRLDLSTNIFPGIPVVIAVASGVRIQAK